MARVVRLGREGVDEVVLGGENKTVSIQSMWKAPIDKVGERELDAIAKELSQLKALGCDIMRFSVPDSASAKSLRKISLKTSMALVADIHFDYRLALECLEGEGRVAAIRINPGNIGSCDKVALVAKACAEKDVAIRIGVNSGSIEKSLLEKVQNKTISYAQALSQSALLEAKVLEDLGFYNYAVSLKSTSAADTILANRLFREKSDVPLHIGVTEAGSAVTGTVKSALALATLLREGLGETVRVSLSDTSEKEVLTARAILEECGARRRGVNLISCPRCGRVGFDVQNFVARWERALLSDAALNKLGVTIAVMGCVVNGVGEGRAADLGVSGSGEGVVFFQKGKIVSSMSENKANLVDNEFRRLIECLKSQKSAERGC